MPEKGGKHLEIKEDLRDCSVKKHLSYKHEDMDLISRTHVLKKSLGMVAGEAETRGIGGIGHSTPNNTITTTITTTTIITLTTTITVIT